MKNLQQSDPTVIGPYRTFARLGRGGMGTVYLAMSPTSREHVAVKVMHRHQAPSRDAELQRRFAREAEALSVLDHPYLVKILDRDLTANPPWIATEYIDGKTLTEYVNEGSRLTDESVGTLARCLVEGLHTLHTNGIIHRDLKPDNVMLTSRGPKIIDFGATLMQHATRLTSIEPAPRTIAYVAPEIYDEKEATGASDIFAFGAVMYFAATGRHLIGGTSPAAIIANIVSGRYDLTDLPPRWEDLIRSCLMLDPHRRPTSAQLKDTLTGSGIHLPHQHWLAHNPDKSAGMMMPPTHLTTDPRGSSLMPQRPTPVTSTGGGHKNRKSAELLKAAIAAGMLVVAIILIIAIQTWSIQDGSMDTRLSIPSNCL